MSYDLIVHIENLSEVTISQWLEEIRKYNMDVEIHPDFSFEKHSGFLPFKIVVYDCPNSSLNNIEWMSGYELLISDYEHLNEEKSIFAEESELSFIEERLQRSNIELTFVAGTQDSFEYRLAWYSAASLVKICDGILTDPQVGIQLEAEQAMKHAYEQVVHNENSLQENEWKVHNFTGWLG